MLIPQVLMYIGFAALSPDGFFSALVDNADEIPKILAVTAVYAVAFAPLALLVSTVASRKAAATGIYLGVLFVGAGLAAALIEATSIPGSRYAALLSIGDHPNFVREWVFGLTGSGETVMSNAGFDPWVSLVIIAVVAVACSVFVVWRYRRLM
jgi:ABC-type transport system involved in multi-copper enzyme maturation permease subunit